MRGYPARHTALWVVALSAVAASPVYHQVLPGYRYQFPRDHFNHPDFRTEWWYYTGNLRSPEGRRYGFELTFFRRGQRREKDDNPSVWRVDDLYLAHVALTDIDGKRFGYQKRLNRAGPGIAGVSLEEGRIWNGNWASRWDKATSVVTLSAVAEGIRFTLRLTPRTPPVIHGENGVSQVGQRAGQAAYYASFPLLDVVGTLNGAAVSGTAWSDHEWFTDLLEPVHAGWDWFSVQLEAHIEIMLFQLRRLDGSADPYSAGTYIDRNGKATHLKKGDFDLQPLEFWTSPVTHAPYPVRWRISVPSFKVSLDCAAALPNQELPSEGTGPTYWEGAVRYSGSATGVGYLEMTGYDKPIRL